MTLLAVYACRRKEVAERSFNSNLTLHAQTKNCDILPPETVISCHHQLRKRRPLVVSASGRTWMRRCTSFQRRGASSSHSTSLQRSQWFRVRLGLFSAESFLLHSPR